MHMLAKVAGVMVCLVGFGIAGVSAQAKEFDQPAAITATLIPLNPDDPAQDRVGKLRYVTGYALTSDHYQFGGLSALLMNGSRIVSIADNSLWWQATFDPADTENPFKNSTLTWQRPRALNKDMKKAGDAESLVRAPFGYLIGFEYYHRIEHVWFPGGLAAVTDSSKQMNFTGIARNSGMEAMTWMGDKLLVFQEKGKDHKGLLRGWIVSGDKAEPLSVRLPENYGVTDATTLPGGDILLLLYVVILSLQVFTAKSCASMRAASPPEVSFQAKRLRR